MEAAKLRQSGHFVPGEVTCVTAAVSWLYAVFPQQPLVGDLLKPLQFVAVAHQLDHVMSAAALSSFKRLASELSFAGRLKPAFHARDHLIKRMLGETVYRPPYPTWASLSQAWLVPSEKEKAEAAEKAAAEKAA